MKERPIARMALLFFAVLMFVSCDIGVSQLIDLEAYQNAGADVAAKTWTENYDCSNFSTQFYQNCYKAGLPCRVRAGQSGGGSFTVIDHAWNSVKLNGVWVNWEPQYNNVYNGHRQTSTPIGWSGFTQEDIVRIIYENVGRYVPEYVIESYEIDKYWNSDSPFYQYFVNGGAAVCLSDNTAVFGDWISGLENENFDNNSGDMFISEDKEHLYEYLYFFFKYNNKYYGMLNLEEKDPQEGRSVNRNTAGEEKIDTTTGFTRTNISFSY